MLIVLMLLASSLLFAQSEDGADAGAEESGQSQAITVAGLEWLQSVDDAILQAEQTGRLVFVYIHADRNCEPCTYMDEVVFSDTEVQDYLLDNFVLVRLTPGGHRGYELVYSGIPAMFILQSNRAELFKTIGAVRPGTFSAILDGFARMVVARRGPSAATFVYDGGLFSLTSGTWEERTRGRTYTYRQYESDETFLYLVDEERGIRLALPRRGGRTWYWDEESEQWSPSFTIELAR